MQLPEKTCITYGITQYISPIIHQTYFTFLASHICQLPDPKTHFLKISLILDKNERLLREPIVNVVISLQLILPFSVSRFLWHPCISPMHFSFHYTLPHPIDSYFKVEMVIPHWVWWLSVQGFSQIQKSQEIKHGW